MKPRTIIGIVFIVASLTKLATIWGIIKWSWFTKISEEPWASAAAFTMAVTSTSIVASLSTVPV